MEAELWIPLITVPILFIFLPWLVLHYVTKWKANSRITAEDETMLDELYELSRRLDDRMRTIERIVADENAGWNTLGSGRPAPRLERGDLPTAPARRSNAPDAEPTGSLS